jgi:hypothetical protein
MGLVLGVVGHRNNYEYVRLATNRATAKHRITLPRTATADDLARAWPATAGTDAVWLDVK